MADVKISALPAASTPLTGAEVLPIVQSGTTKQVAVNNLFTQHTRQVFLSGSAATYTTPANCRQILVRSKGGGGGGGGAAAVDASAGAVGTATLFNSIGAAGGAGGGVSFGNGYANALGGTGGAGSASVRIAGAPGTVPTPLYISATNIQMFGGRGGGQGGGPQGTAGVANSGGGGGGANGASVAFASASNTYASVGGGEGEYVEILINSPSATYTYTVGAGGAAGGAGTGGTAGAAGGSGYIIVDEYY